MSERADPFVHLPSRIVLTKEGLQLFAKTPQNIKKIKNREGVQKEGLDSESYNAATIQKMIMSSYIEEIFLTLPDLLRKRYQIISTNNLVTYAILYKKLSPSLAKYMFESNVVRDFNRKNPKYSIVDLKQVPAQSLEVLLTEKKDLLQSMKTEIHSEVVKRIHENSTFNAEDKQTRLRSLNKFIDWIDRRIWYLYYVIYQTPMKEELIRVFSRMIFKYLDHTQIATHLSNMMMEFIQNAEKAHFERLIVRAGLSHRDEVDKFLRDKENRLKAVELATKHNQMLEVSWNMNPQKNVVGQQYKVQITVSNFGIIDERTRSSLAKKMKTNTEGINLASFYTSGSEDAEKLGAGLGLLYNSYLEDICKGEGIYYRCNIFPEPEKEKTTVKIDITL